MISLDFLGKVSVFKGLAEDQLTIIQECCSEKGFSHGDKLFDEGDEASHLWIVMEGQVDLRFELPGRSTSMKNTITTISKTKTFGWSSLVVPNEYALSAYCATRKCTVVKVEKECLFNLFEKNARLGYVTMSNLSEIIGKRFDRLATSALDTPFALVKITVHLATCGIAAGAREVMTTLMDEMARVDRQDIQIATAGCIGKCKTEPNVTVEIEYTDPVIYQGMTSDRIRQVFQKHILKGEVQTEYVLSDR
jgi:(2Fe-2S) ferredoxin/signal-transduction protein with cAMP-binding, CBS, and nucleotidyltransferase domain